MNNDELKNFKETFPGWDDYYKETDVATMPWFDKNLDHDVEYEIKSNNYNSGNFLDLGTGPGTQALELSKYGFTVTGTDISKHAIEKAQKLSDKIQFLVDDILNSNLPDCEFDFILIEVFSMFLMCIYQRLQYVEQITRILNDNGTLFLKMHEYQ